MPKRISLICGGGFHGKITILETFQFGVYPLIIGDGCEFCMTLLDSVKIRAEDGLRDGRMSRTGYGSKCLLPLLLFLHCRRHLSSNPISATTIIGKTAVATFTGIGLCVLRAHTDVATSTISGGGRSNGVDWIFCVITIYSIIVDSIFGKDAYALVTVNSTLTRGANEYFTVK